MGSPTSVAASSIKYIVAFLLLLFYLPFTSFFSWYTIPATFPRNNKQEKMTQVSGR